MVYVSRKDYQIKHAGHRIELGEIETAAASMAGVTMCCCLYDEIRRQITLFLDKEYTRKEVTSCLSSILPNYMLPEKVIYIEQMPLNANGKIDRTQLKKWLG